MVKYRFALAKALSFYAVLVLLRAAGVSSSLTLGPPIEVPRLPGFNGAHDEGSLAVLEDGSFALARRTYSIGFELLVYSPDGTLVGRPVVAVAPPRLGGLVGGVGPFGDRYFVTWTFPASRQAFAAFYSRRGERLGEVIRWPYSDTLRPYLFFNYARGPHGRILPFFSFQFGQDRFGYPGYASWSRVFDSRAGFLGKRIVLMTNRHFLHPEAAALNEQGRFVVSFLRCPLDPFSPQPCTRGLQRFDGAWRPRSPLRSEGLPPVDDRVGPGLLSLALARTGDHVATWVERIGFEPEREKRVLARIFRSDGLPTPTVLQLNRPGSYEVSLPRARATHDRTFVFAWTDSRDGFGFDMYLRAIDGRTRRLDEQVLVATEPPSPVAGSVYVFDLDLNTSGRGVIWYGDHLRLVTVEPDEGSSLEEDR